MKLSIAELAQAVGKSDNYVRQLILRKHLTAQRQGRAVSVAIEEAARWARDRRLPFNPPVHASAVTGPARPRVARMTVLTSTEPNSEPRNMFTLIRHRREDSLGPWTTTDNTWAHTDLDHGLRLYTLNAPLDHCNGLLDRILRTSKLRIGCVDIHYSLEPVPRCHRAYRDLRPNAEASVRSPFSKNSAEITEYWSFDKDLSKRWLEASGALSNQPARPINRLGFPLDHRSDRVGNMMIAGALDEVTSDLTAHRDTLRLTVQGDNLQAGAYRATVSASHSDDTVLRQEISVISKHTVIPLPSDVDHLGCSIYRTDDGQCVDHMQVHLIKSVSVRMNILDQPSIIIKDRQKRLIQEVTPSGTKLAISAGDDRANPDLDQRIRNEWLGRQSQEREVVARKPSDLVRFGPNKFDDAARHFVGLLDTYSGSKGPIYIADRYFMAHSEGDDVAKLLVQVFSATRNLPLRILCGRIKSIGVAWWAKYPKTITAHVQARTFVNRDGGPAFHDRYLITPDAEFLITTSFNGWDKDGVTFGKNSYGVYRAEAEKLWSMEIDSPDTDLQIKEVC